MAKFCSWCGEPLEPGARYCAECGARVLETVKVDGKRESDPMRGLDIVAGRPIPASKTMKLDRETLEALKLSDGLPGEGAHEPAPAAHTTKMNRAAGRAAVAHIPEVVEVPEIVEVPQVVDAPRAEGDSEAAGAFEVEPSCEAESMAEVAEATQTADASGAMRLEEDGGVEVDEKPETAVEAGIEASVEASDDIGQLEGDDADAAEGANAYAESHSSDADEVEIDSETADGASLEGDASDEDATGDGTAGDSQVDSAASEGDVETTHVEGDPESDEGAAGDNGNVPGGAPSDKLDSSESLQPSEGLSGVSEDDEEDEAVPVIPREAQAAAAKPGPMSFDGTDTLVLPSDAQPKHFGLDRPDLAARKRKRALIALCCVIAALAVAACVLAYMRFGGQPAQESPEPEPTPATQQAEDVATLPDESEQRPVVDGPGEDGQPETLAQEQTAPTDEQIFQTLTSAYVALDGYSDRIYECVNEFNGQYMARSMDARTAAKAKADKVKSDLEAAKAEIESLQIGQASAYVTDAANIIELYECQIGRIGSLCNAWAVSVQYDVPSEHQDEILAALGYQNGGNVYLDRYDALYPSAKPVQK